jgi:hypothetical protein
LWFLSPLLCCGLAVAEETDLGKRWSWGKMT